MFTVVNGEAETVKGEPVIAVYFVELGGSVVGAGGVTREGANTFFPELAGPQVPLLGDRTIEYGPPTGLLMELTVPEGTRYVFNGQANTILAVSNEVLIAPVAGSIKLGGGVKLLVYTCERKQCPSFPL